MGITTTGKAREESESITKLYTTHIHDPSDKRTRGAGTSPRSGEFVGEAKTSLSALSGLLLAGWRGRSCMGARTSLHGAYVLAHSRILFPLLCTFSIGR